jgi:hypothetical protein
MNKIPASLRSDFSDCRFAPECMPLCIGFGGDFIGIRIKKRLVDQTLESRARKWADMGKPWFGGLASGWERREFRRSGAISRLSAEYLNASRRARWIRIGGILLPLALRDWYMVMERRRDG